MSVSKPRRFDRDVDGILLLDKPLGVSSNNALQQARGLFRALKAGHAGSLDPLASGMLPICFGQATKVCGLLLDARKTYRFTMRLGELSDTGDAEGKIVDRQPVPSLSDEQIAAALRARSGEQQQVPPMYSALKHRGERLYALARRGETVERAPRTIVVETLICEGHRGPDLDLKVRCSKGTYVRTLAEDIARHLGTVAHLTALRRLEVDPFAGKALHTLEQLRERSQSGELDSLLIPSDQALLHLPVADFDQLATEALLHGQSAVSGSTFQTGTWVRLYGPERRFLGLGESLGGDAIQPRRLFVNSTLNP